jgi:hypothetical protein
MSPEANNLEIETVLVDGHATNTPSAAIHQRDFTRKAADLGRGWLHGQDLGRSRHLYVRLCLGRMELTCVSRPLEYDLVGCRTPTTPTRFRSAIAK